MYSSNYTHVPRYTLEAQKKKQMQRSKGKSCGYYMRIIFFFSSLIQSLIIVSLVLFLVYGMKTDSPASDRIADLEQSFNRLSLENVALKQQRKNLTKTLNGTAMERLQMDLDLGRMRNLSNVSYQIISELNARLNQCTADKNRLSFPVGGNCQTGFRLPIDKQGGDCPTKLEHQKAKERYLQSQLNQTVLENTIKIDKLNKERDDLSLEAIDLRNDKQMLQSEITSYRLRCKQDFVASLSGISNVSRAFLEKIDSLFPNHIPFQLSCDKQRENLEQIRSNCTSLSREVEDKFQRYLDTLGTQVSYSLGRITHLQADNQRLEKVNRICSANRTGLIQEHRQNLQRAQLQCDDARKKLLVEKKRLTGDKELLESKMRVKETEILHLKDQNRQLNASCSQVNQFGRSTFGGSSSSAGNPFRLGSTSNTGSLGSSLGSTGINKPATNGINVGLGGAIGADAGKKPLTGLSYGTGLGSTNLGNSKPGSTNLGSSWPSSNGVGNTRLGGTASQGGSWSLPGTGLGSSATGLGRPSTGSTTSKVPGSSGTGGWGTALGKFGSTSTGLGTGLGAGLGNTGLGTGLGAGLGNTGLGSRLGAGLGNTGLGAGLGNTGLGSTGLGTSGLGRGTTTSGSFGGLGGGRTAGTGSVLSQHLAELQRYGKPSSTEKKSESPRNFG